MSTSALRGGRGGGRGHSGKSERRDDGPMRVALPFRPCMSRAELLARIDAGYPPENVEEYLMRVRLQRDQMAEVTTSDIDSSKYAHKQTKYMPDKAECGVSRASVRPSRAWERAFLASFADLRQAIRHWATRTDRPRRRLRLPKAGNRNAWRSLCFDTNTPAAPEAEGGGAAGSSGPAGTGAGVGVGAGGGRSHSTFNPTGPGPLAPHLQVLLQLDEVSVRRLLSANISWAAERGSVDRSQAAWLFSLMACVDKPLLPDSMSQLRQLYRVCETQRAAIEDPASPELPHINVIITLVVRFFDQRDLLETPPDAVGDSGDEEEDGEEVDGVVDADGDVAMGEEGHTATDRDAEIGEEAGDAGAGACALHSPAGGSGFGFEVALPATPPRSTVAELEADPRL